jgi:hypothetical protein
MSSEYDTSLAEEQEIERRKAEIIQRLQEDLLPLLERLDAYLDKRLVRTALELIAVLILSGHPKQGLHVSQLGACLLGGAHAPAGTKRIERLLHSKKWSASISREYLWQEAAVQVNTLMAEEKLALCVWDGSRIEKPESEQTEGMCAVLSSKAKRLRKKRKGVYNPPGGKPITVLGLEWIGILVVGLQGLPYLARMEYWSRKGEHASTMWETEKRLLREAVQWLGKQVLYVFDRGYAGATWLQALQEQGVLFVIRWVKSHHFLDAQGEEKALWEIARGEKTWGYRSIEEAHTHTWLRKGVVAMPIRHAGYAGALWLVVGRGGKEPWYLLTNQPVETEEAAWQIIMSYARRWKAEEMFRFEKSELGIESCCVREWEGREKLLGLLTLAHRFLLSLCDPARQELKEWLLRHGCHRTGKRYRAAKLPLYRLRWALSTFWREHSPLPLLAHFFPSFYRPDIRSKNSG